MAKYKVVLEHPTIGVYDFEYEVAVGYERMWQIASLSAEHNGVRLIDVVEIES